MNPEKAQGLLQVPSKKIPINTGKCTVRQLPLNTASIQEAMNGRFRGVVSDQLTTTWNHVLAKALHAGMCKEKESFKCNLQGMMKQWKIKQNPKHVPCS